MTLVIGFGNPLRGDDAAGPSVARSADLARPDVVVLTLQQLLPELAPEVATADVVVFIDATTDLPAGEVRCQAVDPSATPRLDHILSPAALVGLGLATFGHAPYAWLVEIGADSFDLGNTLTPAVADAVPRAVALVRTLIPPAGLKVGSYVVHAVAAHVEVHTPESPS
ncbi:MAG: hydrogenase maturation protease [Vicinamibacterales bacterium]